MPENLTIAEVLAALRISRGTYYLLVRSGKLHPVNVSPRRVLVPKAEIEAILNPKKEGR